MQAYSTTTDLQRYSPDRLQSHEDEGFAQQEVQSLIVPKPQVHDDLELPKTRKHKVLYREPKLKLKFVSQQKNTKNQLAKSILNKESSRSYQARSLENTKRQSKKSLQIDLLAECVAKIKRTAVGQNLSIPTFSLADSKNIKNHIMTSGGTLIYEQTKQINTHGYIRNIVEQSSSLLCGNLNQLLNLKMRDSFIMPKKPCKLTTTKDLQFQGNYQNSNLQFVSQVSQGQYDLYLKNDTNTHGHQSWFSFKVKNWKEDSNQTVVLNVCNLKRNLTMYNEGAKVYIRKQGGQWQQGGNNIQFKCNNNAKFTNVRVYKLSFELTLESSQTLQVSLLPGYTYSDLLQQLNTISVNCKHLTIQTLTYSLVGLAIPLLTFTRNSENNDNKQVILISSRIHPGQTNSSFMCSGLINWLAQDNPKTRDFLDKHIVKIIPMINPDGVIFGNFRTNFLGADLNRSFDTQDQIINPEVSALKQLGLMLKQEYGQRFNLFLDLHGHSSAHNIFSYGPDYDSSDSNFYQIRLLPKILQQRSKMFKYYNCTFKLQEYKKHTARGFYLNNVGVLAYTIEASYSFYQDEGKLVSMGPEKWMAFGKDLAESLMLLSKVSKLSLLRNKLQIKKALSQVDKQQLDMIKRFKKEFKTQKQQPIQPEIKPQKGAQDSDGEGDCQDYTRAQKQQVMRRVAQTSAPNSILPRVLKPSIVYPTVTPKLFQYRQEYEETQLKILYTRRASKYNGLRMNGNSYILNLRGMDPLKLDTRNSFF